MVEKGEVISDVIRVLIGVVIAAVGITILAKIAVSSDCIEFANQTALQLQGAINKVGSDGYPPFPSSTKEPSLENSKDKTYFEAVPIKLCQEDIRFNPINLDTPLIGGPVSSLINSIPGALGATPRYQLFYELPPGADAAWWAPWGENYPWSGGAGSALLFYGALRFGPKIVKFGFSTAVKGLAYPIVFGRFAIEKLGRLGKAMIKVANFFRKVDATTRFKEVRQKLLGRTLKVQIGHIAEAEGKNSRQISRELQNIWNDIKKNPTYLDEASRKDQFLKRVINDYPNAFPPGSAANLDNALLSAWTHVKWIKSIRHSGYQIVLDESANEAADSLTVAGKIMKFVEVNAKTGVEKTDKFGRLLIAPENRRAVRNFLDMLPESDRAILEKVFYAPTTFQRWLDRRRVGVLGKFWGNVPHPIRRLKDVREDVHQRYKVWRATGIARVGGDISNVVADKGDIDRLMTTFFKVCIGNSAKCKQMVQKAWSEEFSNALLAKLRKRLGREEFNMNDFSKYLAKETAFTKDNKLLMIIPDDMRLKRVKFSERLLVDNYIDRFDSSSPKAFQNFEEFTDWIKTKEARGVRSLLVGDLLDSRGNIRDLKAFGELRYLFNSAKGDARRFFHGAYTPGRIEKYTNSLYERYFNNMISGVNEQEQARFVDFLTGKIESSVISSPSHVARLTKRVLLLDEQQLTVGALFGGPISFGFAPYSDRQLQKDIAASIQQGSGKSLVLSVQGDAVVYPLNITDTTVRVWRPKMDASRLLIPPTFIQTSLMYPSVQENPIFYSVSPCFGMAKVWKNGGQIYVSVDKLNNINKNNPQLDWKFKTSDGTEYSSFCYADKTLVWGEDSKNDFVSAAWGVALGGATACTAAVTAASLGTGAGVAVKSCFYAAAGIYTGGMIAAGKGDTTDTVGGSKWGYYTWYKASDGCDILTTIASFGAKGAAKAGAKTALRGAVGKGVTKTSSGLGRFVPDLCFALQYFGDTELSWPARGNKGLNLNATAIIDQSPALTFGPPATEVP